MEEQLKRTDTCEILVVEILMQVEGGRSMGGLREGPIVRDTDRGGGWMEGGGQHWRDIGQK